VRRVKDPFVHHLVIDGRLAGSWSRTVNAQSVVVECAVYKRPASAAAQAIDEAAARLGRFLQRPAVSVRVARS